ncbi:HNH endonuclease [Gluconobacter japonicus]|uniref:HNH endonuclease n=1 Tax=Gluconobacter japonicus TaxID=376620 RepID=UPI0009EE3C16
MANCIICNHSLTSQNDSAEHIIPNAIGGFRKVWGFLCNRCNNTTGHDWDAAWLRRIFRFSPGRGPFVRNLYWSQYRKLLCDRPYHRDTIQSFGPPTIFSSRHGGYL